MCSAFAKKTPVAPSLSKGRAGLSSTGSGRPETQARPERHAVVIVGAGPVGLCLAIDLAQRGQQVLLLDRDRTLASGSRAICFAKRTLEIFDRLGVGEQVTRHGVRWQRGKVFFGEHLVYDFDLLPEAGHERPAFVNLPQSCVEGLLVERAQALPAIELRWGHAVSGVEARNDGVRLTVDTPQGAYALDADWLLACDGARSTLRRLMGLEVEGRVFRDRFLIADVRMHSDALPAERWFWFDPPFHPGYSVLLHRQPEDLWRIDFQLGWDADPEAEKQPERIAARVQALLRQGFGRELPFTLEWASVYTFACQRMARFRHGRVVFAGDAAHGVSPFGARGANSGIQDADNLGWKLAAVLRGDAGDALIDSYGAEREAAADENIRHSARSTDFITPKSEASRLLRDTVLALAREHAFARTLVNSGRLSQPAHYAGSLLNSRNDEARACAPGAAAPDAPVQRCTDGAWRDDWFLRMLGPGFTALLFGAQADAAPLLALPLSLPLRRLRVLAPGEAEPPLRQEITLLRDRDGLLASRCDARRGDVLLWRPDQHLCARWAGTAVDAASVGAAMQRALAAAVAVQGAAA